MEHHVTGVVFKDGKHIPEAFSAHLIKIPFSLLREDLSLCFMTLSKTLKLFQDFRTGFDPNSDPFALTVPVLRCGS